MAIHVAIIGIDGCGKSTCYREVMKRFINGKSIAGVGDEIWVSGTTGSLKEPRGLVWLSIRRFFAKMTKLFRNMLFYKIMKYIELLCRVQIRETLENKYKPQFIFTDGSPLVNVVGWGSHYHKDIFTPEQCKKVIQYLCGNEKIPIQEMFFYLKQLPEVFFTNFLGLGRYALPEIIIFLQLDPQIAIDRILKRGKKVQMHEYPEFLNNLQKAYTSVCDLMETEFGVAVHKLRADELTIEETVTRVIDKLEKYEER
jgi:hypothetical protein